MPNKRLTWALTAFRHAKWSLVIGAGNRPQRVEETDGLSKETVRRIRGKDTEWEKQGWRKDAKGKWRPKWVQQLPSKKHKIYTAQFRGSAHERAYQIADRAMEFGAGNCGEHARVAYKYLCENIPDDEIKAYIDNVLLCKCRGKGDHAFVVIGALTRDGIVRLTSSDPKKGDAIICDPWGGFVCTAQDLKLASGKHSTKIFGYYGMAEEESNIKRVQQYIKHWGIQVISTYTGGNG